MDDDIITVVAYIMEFGAVNCSILLILSEWPCFATVNSYQCLLKYSRLGGFGAAYLYFHRCITVCSGTDGLLGSELLTVRIQRTRALKMSS